MNGSTGVRIVRIALAVKKLRGKRWRDKKKCRVGRVDEEGERGLRGRERERERVGGGWRGRVSSRGMTG